MGTRTWTGAVDNKWETNGNWSGNNAPNNGDDVILNGNSAYSVNLSTATSVKSISIGTNGNSNAIKLVLNSSSASLTVSNAITFLQPTATIEGQGAINAGGGFLLNGSGSATIQAGTASTGGTLDVTGAIASNIQLGFANTTVTSVLKLESTSTINSAIAITSATQTLEIGATASLTLGIGESITNGTIKLDGGSLTDTTGFAIGAGAKIIGTGTVTGPISGSGTITASGGNLTLTGSITSSGTAASLVVGNGSTLTLTSTYGIGTSGAAPTLTFQGTGDVFQAVNAQYYAISLGTISGFAAGDLIKIHSIGTGDTLTYSGNTITIHNGGTTQTFTFDSSVTASQITLTQSGTVDTLQIICFMAGTLIRTPEGEVAVETLKRGDLVETTTGAVKPITWLGRQTVSSRFADPVRSWPIRILAGALGENVPARDLLVSPDHALLVGGALVHAGALVNGSSIQRLASVPNGFVYYHVELDDHSLILAENVPAETFIDNVDRMHFDNWAEHEALYPDGKAVAELPYPRVKARRQLPAAIRKLLDERAVAILGASDRDAA
ncbi:Hint domain-containing protein [Rhodoblastus sp.]|jgi:hypothetical protein|uniref:Hint domain-containing protein n=1 Tax=Rhodoblastus sp. TaxID=1962975 RepID=UPI0025D20B41|nr:Hint domain-containing protein [Rhodoblastus sp.]